VWPGLACIFIGEPRNHMIVNLHGGKADQMGVHSYGKRFAPNWLEVENCFVTAVGRIIFSRAADDNSSYLYMSEKQAERYEKSLAEKVANNQGKEEPVRVRANGPHTRFRVHFKRGIKKVACKSSVTYVPKLITPHSEKKTAYRRVKRLHAISQQDVNGRAGGLVPLLLCYVALYFSFRSPFWKRLHIWSQSSER
jgi:hypothetical protein